ncbi:hypothetical protein GCM10007989_17960 [Devosia pacifica]|uniref:Palmitoyl-protein thioesterase ABHD10, mitochondrial n=2 Tax=Devosia pacifica TaxID=1335967 RepID=A0A918VTL6_9HYPH|nr:hypothetical protein GCM10007989_17960 [Devosia pacifica]
MAGTKAAALDALGAETGLAVTRFDYSGHGHSGGDFADGTITRWLEEARVVFDSTTGDQLLVGSSMGGWLALLLARQLRSEGIERVKAIVLIAPAVDMTEALMLAALNEEQRRKLDRDGYVDRLSTYSSEPDRLTKTLIEDGRNHLMFGAVIETGCPVTILQGGMDPDVPQAHAHKLAEHILHDPVTLTLIPDGDHRLSREQDLACLRAAVRRAARL